MQIKLLGIDNIFFEVGNIDQWNNKIGFADYTKKPALARLTD